MPPLLISAPESLIERLCDQADAQGVTPNDLAVALLAVPLEAVARVHRVKCETCGVLWTSHSPECSRHAYRPDWAREYLS